jgi:hypothetical protein
LVYQFIYGITHSIIGSWVNLLHFKRTDLYNIHFITLEVPLIDWYLTPTLAVFQLYPGLEVQKSKGND